MNPPIATGTEPCRERPDDWFPEKGHQATAAKAKRLCQGCALIGPCAEFGILHEAWGIYGGLSAEERAAIRKLRGIGLQTPHAGIVYAQRKPGPDHGDEAGYKRHMRRGENPCRPCYEGNLRARQDRAKRRAS